MSTVEALAQTGTTKREARRDLLTASLAHVLHDGYTDLLYVLLPIWRKEYGLTYAALAGMRALYYGTMALAQVPVQHVFGRLGASLLLTLGTLLAAGGFFVAGLTSGLAGLCVGLTLSGLGSSTQHPNGSALVSNAYGETSRGPLGIYNFAGDAGKAIFPAVTSLLLLGMAWRPATLVIGAVGVATAIAIPIALPRRTGSPRAPTQTGGRAGTRKGFRLLFAIGALDTACRMGYLLFLPFILTAAGARDATIGIALSLVFIGGALGKAVCGWLGERLGLFGTVAVSEAACALLILVTMVVPLPAIVAILPVLGIALNGTSSVLYGTVPAFSAPGRAAHMFAVFYTGVIGAGAIAPIAYGAFADVAGRSPAIVLTAVTALATVPLMAVMVGAMNPTDGEAEA